MDSKAVTRVKRKDKPASDIKDYITNQIQESTQRQVFDRIRESITHEDGTHIIPEMASIIVSFMCNTVITVGYIRDEVSKLDKCLIELRKEDEKLYDEYDGLNDIHTHYTEASDLTSKYAQLIPMAVPRMDTGEFMERVVEPALARHRQSNEHLRVLEHSKSTLEHLMAMAVFAQLPYRAFELFGKVNSYAEFTKCELQCTMDQVDMRTEEKYVTDSDEDDMLRRDNCVEAYQFSICIGDHAFHSGYIAVPCITPVVITSEEPKLLELYRYLRLDGREDVSFEDKLYKALRKCFKLTVSGVYNPDMALTLWNRLSERGISVNAIVLIICLFRITESAYAPIQYDQDDGTPTRIFLNMLEGLVDKTYPTEEELDMYQATTESQAKISAAADTADAIASREHKKRKLAPPSSTLSA